MPTTSCTQTICCLLPRICESVSLRPDSKCASVCLSQPLPDNAGFSCGMLHSAPSLENLFLCPLHAGHGCRLDAQLHLPVCLCFHCGCELISRTGCITLPIQALLRTKSFSALQYIPQAELCIRNIFVQNGCMCAKFDLQLCIYAVRWQPVQLSAPCAAPESSDCTPYFHLPLYPELRNVSSAKCRTGY